MKNIIKWLSNQKWIYDFAVKLVFNRVVHGQNKLTSDYLKKKGWVEENGFHFESGVKESDRVWIKFENHYFRVYHGKDKVFIGLESGVEWFENYYLLIHSDNGRHEIVG